MPRFRHGECRALLQMERLEVLARRIASPLSSGFQVVCSQGNAIRPLRVDKRCYAGLFAVPSLDDHRISVSTRSTASLCQETGYDESRLCNASSLAFMPHVPSTLRAARWGNHRISTHHASVRRQLEASVKRQSTQRPSKSACIACSRRGAETSAPAMSGHSCYNQPDRLKPTHSTPHSAAIPSRVAS